VPILRQAHPITVQLLRRIDGQLRFVFRNFPLTTMHRHAELAAEAAESAGAQGKLWEMHDSLHENQEALEPEDLLQYAADLGLDIQRFSNDLAMHAYLDRIREDLMSGVQSGVQGTPSFFINGVRRLLGS
jgi:protein-disulfide isomerase